MANQEKIEALRAALRAKRLKRFPRPRKIIYPITIERSYDRALTAMVAKAYELVNKRLVPKLKGMTEAVAEERGVKLDSYSDDVVSLMNGVRLEYEKTYTKKDIAELARKTGKSVDYWNERQLKGSLGSVVDIDLFGDEAWLDSEMSAFSAENVNLITSLSGDFFSDVETRTMRMLGEGERWETIAGELTDRYGVTKSRANLIARDQIGKLQGQLTELRQKEVGLTHYIWRTAGDDRVRTSHLEHANKRFAWSSPPANTGHPGEDYQCRCYAEPDLSEFMPK